MPSSWPRDPLDRAHEGLLPASVVDHLRSFRDGVPGARVVFLRRSFATVETPTLFVARPSESQPDLREWTLERYTDLLRIDLGRAAAGEGGAPRAGPLFLVCTHGRHDRCCARWGNPFYRRLSARAEQSTWQSSHIGGDRFAANLLWLPWGVFYGRLLPEEVDRLVTACERREILLDRYRGRSCHPFPVQAAEYHFRRATDELRPDGVRVLGVESENDDLWSVRLEARPGSAAAVRATVRIARRRSGFELRPTCSAGSSRPVPLYDLLGIEEEA